MNPSTHFSSLSGIAANAGERRPLACPVWRPARLRRVPRRCGDGLAGNGCLASSTASISAPRPHFPAISGEPPETAGQRPALPGTLRSFLRGVFPPQCFFSPALFLLAFFLCIFQVHAGNTSVSAALSADTTTTDQPVSLTITVTGGMNADIPSDLQVDGLDVEFRGQSRRIEMINFSGTVSVTNTYVLSPQHEGKFTIPSVEIQSEGKALKTDPLTLTVTKGGGGNGNGQNSGQDSAPKIFSELIIPQSTAYVGEIIPTEVRFYFDNDVQFQVNPPGQVPQISGEGFSKLRYPQPRVEQTQIKGHNYRVLIYKTAIVAAKAGDLQIGPSALDFVVSLPQRQQGRSPLTDPFGNLGNDPFGGIFQDQRIERQMSVRGDAVTLKVKPLPVGKPEGFSGAVGQFTLQASAKPGQVKIGDPVTLISIVSGHGNFDLVAAPALIDSRDWRTYPPTGQLSTSDELGVAGDKTFQMAVIPQAPSQAVPPVQFSYFDPTQEKYVTLHTEPIPITVDGQAVVVATPTPELANISKPTPETTPANPAPEEVPILTTWSGPSQTFTPIWRQPIFWAAQGVPLLLLLGLAGPRLLARFQPNAAAVRRRRWLEEWKALQPGLRSDQPDTFFPVAARALELEADRQSGRNRPPVGVDEILTSLGFADDEAETAREIFRRRDELAYGGGRGGRELSAETKRKYEALLPKGVLK